MAPTGLEGIVLRYGAFYGPGTSLAPGEEQFELVRLRKFPLVGDGGGVCGLSSMWPTRRKRPWRRSSTAVAVSTTWSTMIPPRSLSGCRRWLSCSAQGSRCEFRGIGRLFAGDVGAVMMTELRGASNTKAKLELGWRPAHRSWRQGFVAHDRSRTPV